VSFNVQAITPYGTFQMNELWTADLGPAIYLGLSPSPGNSNNDPALIFVFSSDLRQSALDGTPDPLLPLGSGSNFIPGGSALALSVFDLYNGPQTDLLSVSGTFTPAVPEPSTWAMLLLGFAGIGFMAYRRRSKPALMVA
jgi:PEP-CTERM motif